MDEKRGNHLAWSKKEIEDLAKPSPSDIERAKVFWRANANKEAKDILDARSE